MSDDVENLLYFLDDKPYLNMTNACTNTCVFCIRDEKEDVQGANLWMKKDDNKLDDFIAQIEANKGKLLKSSEIVFCGYGEPLIKLNEALGVCKYLKENFPNLKIRINTNGHANAIFKRNIVKELKPYVNSISVSLNAQNKEMYDKISKPKIENAYEEVKRFIRACVEEKIDTTASVVSKVPDFEVDVERCQAIAESLGAKFRNREFIENGYWRSIKCRLKK